jgi:hypothetical protein
MDATKTPSWQAAVATPAAERERAVTAVRLIRRPGDPGARDAATRATIAAHLDAARWPPLAEITP